MAWRLQTHMSWLHCRSYTLMVLSTALLDKPQRSSTHVTS
jgi:hypothetical protein